MKQFQTAFTLAAVLALAAFVAACATTQSQENLAIAAGFKVINPVNTNQQAILMSLPPGQVSPVNHKGKRYYVLPDAPNNQAYVGGPKQYQAYQQLRMARQLSNENLEAAEMNEMASEDWGAWGGWGGWGPAFW